MKKVNYILTILCGAALLASSCSKLNTVPVFDAAESFASIPVETASVAENKGQIVIPVQVASIDPVKTSISYKLIDGTAKAGVDYEDTNASAVLTFDGEQRTADIVIKIIDRPGDYTGDLDFSVELVAATGLKLSMEKACKVTINDLDHPLAAILGRYTASAVDVGGPATWELMLTKDAKDVTVVWCSAIAPIAVGKSWSPVYGTVAKDEETGRYTISFPCGQSVVDDYQGEGEMLLCETYISNGEYFIDDKTILVFDQTETGFVSTQGMGFVNNYLYYGGFLLGDKSTPGNKVVWKKITE